MTARLIRAVIFMAAFFIAGTAFAAGGSCPSGANYLNPSGSLVTLSSLGVTSCYYIAANGSDSNDGLSEASGHPWLHAPQMPNCSGNCATLQNTGSGIPPGTGLIVRGGDTWHFGNSGASPYTGGAWGFSTGKGPAGTSSNPIYVGVDQTWYSGASWARPILTWDNAASTSQTLGSCTYPMPAGNFVDFSGGAYYIFDNFEITGMCTSSTNWQPDFVAYGSMSGYMNLYNLYIHGWTHVGFSNVNNCTEDNQCMEAFGGSVSSVPPGDTLLYDVVDGSDSDGVPMVFCYCGAWRVAYSYFNNGSQFITRNQNSFHDNVITNFVDNGHANLMESAGYDATGASNAAASYNNIFAHIFVLNDGTTSNQCMDTNPPVGSTEYWFNNIWYDVGPCEFFIFGNNGSDNGTHAIFNNTMQFRSRSPYGGGSDGFSCSATSNAAPYTDWNNHYISDDNANVAAMYAANCSGQGSDTTSLLMTNATATSDGYTSSETYVSSPISGSSPTVGQGTNRTSTFCAALTTASGTDAYLDDAASACQNDTRYACTYLLSSHAVSCPARTPIGRPSGAWDIGAYQYSSSVSSDPPNPPTGLTVAVQ